ncbi:uncharacterized protein LOC127453376 [Myxocyprinus asiaticus]|uniref:uncharacterized protein LOC127453376 n=1 Tax=Myxocyprinus asiaticus TaxID=70543 RepID=UPI00222245AA|nr:uncharacterized protein LOC127453376 [Myxocyprinus asiaticus]
MASSMTTTANGVTVVMHIPTELKNEFLDPKESLVVPEKPSLPPATRMFLKRKPLSLGLVQVFTGLVIMALSTITLVINTLPAEIVFTLGLPFVISGSVAIVAHSRSNLTLIKTTLAMSVMCAVMAAGGIGYFSWQLSIRPENGSSCDEGRFWICSYNRSQAIWQVTKQNLASLFQDETDVDFYGSESSLLKDGVDCASKP